MRPIDADILKYCISQEAEAIEKSEDDILVVVTLKVIVECFLRIIDKTPTIPTFMMETFMMEEKDEGTEKEISR